MVAKVFSVMMLASIVLIAPAATAEDGGDDWPHCAVVQIDDDGTVHVHKDCVKPLPDPLSWLKSGCDIIVIHKERPFVSVNPDCT